MKRKRIDLMLERYFRVVCRDGFQASYASRSIDVGSGKVVVGGNKAAGASSVEIFSEKIEKLLPDMTDLENKILVFEYTLPGSQQQKAESLGVKLQYYRDILCQLRKRLEKQQVDSRL